MTSFYNKALFHERANYYPPPAQFGACHSCKEQESVTIGNPLDFPPLNEMRWLPTPRGRGEACGTVDPPALLPVAALFALRKAT